VRLSFKVITDVTKAIINTITKVITTTAGGYGRFIIGGELKQGWVE
jgi:hypothetical protein